MTNSPSCIFIRISSIILFLFLQNTGIGIVKDAFAFSLTKDGF